MMTNDFLREKKLRISKTIGDHKNSSTTKAISRKNSSIRFGVSFLAAKDLSGFWKSGSPPPL